MWQVPAEPEETKQAAYQVSAAYRRCTALPVSQVQEQSPPRVQEKAVLFESTADGLAVEGACLWVGQGAHGEPVFLAALFSAAVDGGLEGGAFLGGDGGAFFPELVRSGPGRA